MLLAWTIIIVGLFFLAYIIYIMFIKKDSEKDYQLTKEELKEIMRKLNL